MRKPVMISLCDYTGVMARPWAEAGVICLCIDTQHSIRATRGRRHKVEHFESGGQIHFLYGDARSWKPTDFDREFHKKYQIVFVACFPVCTNLTASGAQDRILKGLAMLTDGLMLFNSCEQIADWSGAAYCIENPAGCIPTHHREADYYFHPWHFGDMYQKMTCLWCGNGFIMPEYEFVVKPEGVTEKIIDLSPSLFRQNLRSETPQGFAKAVFTSNYPPSFKTI